MTDRQAKNTVQRQLLEKLIELAAWDEHRRRDATWVSVYVRGSEVIAQGTRNCEVAVMNSVGRKYGRVYEFKTTMKRVR